MNTSQPTSHSLKMALAGMLPELIEQDVCGFFIWRDHKDAIKDTEWLHVCWLVEQTLDESQVQSYKARLCDICEFRENKVLGYWPVIRASWQQRAQALCEVKGVEV